MDKFIFRLWPNGSTDKINVKDDVLSTIQDAVGPVISEVADDVFGFAEKRTELWSSAKMSEMPNEALRNPYASFVAGRLLYGPVLIAASKDGIPSGLTEEEIVTIKDRLDAMFCEKKHEQVCLRIWRNAEPDTAKKNLVR